MTRRLLIAVSPGEVWAVLATDGEVEALRLARASGAPRRGDLYRGRVVGLRPEVPAALVEIGTDRPGFLDLTMLSSDARPREGEAVVVKVTRPARADKAAGVTLKLTAQDRAHAAAARDAAPPALLYRADTAVAAVVADLTRAALDEILIDDAAAVAEARAWLKRQRPELSDVVALHRDETALFDVYGVSDAIESVLTARVALPGGGAIIIETTAAATLIDVDGGTAGALAANLAAAKAIARQLRLRDLSGPIVIDFIGMTVSGQRARVAAALADAFTERDEMQLLGWTRLGHFELVRPRRRPSLTELLFEHRPGSGQIKSALTVALEALRQLQRDSRRLPGKRFALTVHPDVAACFDREARDAYLALTARLGYAVAVTAAPCQRDRFIIEPV